MNKTFNLYDRVKCYGARKTEDSFESHNFTGTVIGKYEDQKVGTLQIVLLDQEINNSKALLCPANLMEKIDD